MAIMTSKTIHARPATLSDVDELVKIINYAYRGGKQAKSWTGEEHLVTGARVTAEELGEIVAAADRHLYVAELEESGQRIIVGSVVLETGGENGYIGMLSVDPDVQSAGIGKTLMAYAERQAQLMGKTAIDMWILSGRPELQSWYERLGYAVTGNTEPFPEGRCTTLKPGLHFLVLRKELT